MILSLPEEETFGQPSIDLPGLGIARDFGLGLGIRPRASRSEAKKSVAVVEEVKEEGGKPFENMNMDANVRGAEGRGNKSGLKGDEPKEMKERKVADMLDRPEDDDDEVKDNGLCDQLKRTWQQITGRCCCS